MTLIRSLRFASVLVGALLLVSACGGGGGGSDPATEPDSSPESGSPDGDAEAGVSGLDLIDQALADGALDAESALLYKTYAAFNDPRLPSEYAGDTPGIVDPDFLWEATSEFESLSTETQETLASFLIPPMYSGSWWDLQENWGSALRARSADAPCSPLRANCPLLTSWKYLEGTHINVWYQEKYEAEDLAKAVEILNVIEQLAWPNLTAYMGAAPLPDRGGSMIAYEGPDSKLDIALVDMAALGTAYPSFAFNNCGESSTYILINRTADPGPTSVHELMHAIQFGLPVKECLTSGYKTLMESTANWAVNRVYGTSNQWEHQHVYAYTNDIRRSLLNDSPNLRPYGAYLFPFYLTESDHPDAVRNAWNLARNYSQPQVYENLVSLDEVWPQFAARLWDWSQAPFDEFSTWDSIPHDQYKAVKVGKDEVRLDLAGKPYEEWVVSPGELPGLSAHIFHVVMHDPSIRTAGFFNGFSYQLAFEEVPELGNIVTATDLDEQQRSGAHVHALVKQNGVWEESLRDWTDVPYVLFPLDLEGSPVEEVLLIFSNSNADPGAGIQHTGLPSHFWLTNMPWMSEWEGSASLSSVEDGVTQQLDVRDVRFEHLGSTPPAVFEAPDQEAELQMIPYQLTAGTVEWSIGGTDSQGCSYRGGGTRALTAGFLPNQFMLYSFIRSGPAAHGFLLNGYDQFPPIEWPVTVTCPDGEGGTTSSTDYMGHGDLLLSSIPGDSSATLSADGLSISGTGDDAMGEGVSGSWTLQVAP